MSYLANAAVEAGTTIRRLAWTLRSITVFASPASWAFALVAAERWDASTVVSAWFSRNTHVLVLASIERKKFSFWTKALRSVYRIDAADRISWARFGSAKVDLFLAMLSAESS